MASHDGCASEAGAPAALRPRWLFLLIMGLTPPALLGCEADPSCTDTATCEPFGAKDGGDSGTRRDAADAQFNGHEGGTLADSSAIDARPQLDSTILDGVGTESATDPVDRRDVLAQDGSIDRASDSGVVTDVSTDTGMLDSQNPGDDASTELDGSGRADSRDEGPSIEDSGDDSTTSDSGVDACPLNACGGCGVLGAVPGASCGSCGKYVCSADKGSVSCDHPDFLKVRQVSLGRGNTCALLETGGVRCWGAAAALGDGSMVARLIPPPSDIPGLSAASAISVGSRHACALLAAGTVRCWGGNDFGQLGNGSTTESPTPAAEALTGATAIAAGGFHTCALLSSGRVRCWGENFYGELGDGTTTDRYTQAADIPDLDGVTAITAGQYHTCALLVSGSARCWGFNFSGQLGDATNTDRATPGVDIPGLTGVSAIHAGQSHTCAQLASGAARCWGFNGYGQLGDDTKTPRNTVGSDIPGIEGLLRIVPGVFHTCALLTGGVRCWGANTYGQLGNGTTTEFLRPPDANIPNLGAVSAVEAAFSTCALLNSGQLRCWGPNADGVIGDGSTMNRLSPTEVVGMCP